MKDAKQREKELREENERFKRSVVDIDAASAEFSREEIKRLNALYEAATDENQSRDDRVKYATKLQELYPAYFGNLDKEAILVGNARTQYDLLCNSILDVARARAAQQKIEENESQLLDLEDEYEIRSEDFCSMGKATPFEGWRVNGRCLATVCDGKVVYKKA